MCIHCAPRVDGLAPFEVENHVCHKLFCYDAVFLKSRPGVAGVNDHLLDVDSVRHLDLRAR